jgi:hypothetical protein
MALSGTRTESSGLREFLNSPTGKMLSVGFAVVVIAVAGFLIWRSMGLSEAEAMSRDRIFIDSKTMKPFEHELKIGDMIPVDAPSGGKTGYPAELCYWTKDGKEKKDPTPVLLKHWIGETGPTFCPDCGRLVVGHNPMPGPTAKVPPLKSEYKETGSSRGR